MALAIDEVVRAPLSLEGDFLPIMPKTNTDQARPSGERDFYDGMIKLPSVKNLYAKLSSKRSLLFRYITPAC